MQSKPVRMKPVKVFLAFLSILALLVMIAYIFPSGGIQILPGIRLNFPSVADLVNYDQNEYKDISELIDENAPVDTIAPVIEDTLSLKTSPDSIGLKKDTATTQAEDTQPRATRPQPKMRENSIQYPRGDHSILQSFFQSLRKVKKENELIRILHYGDSQIEGDRISSYIRNQLQKEFGGAGIGLIPAVLPHNTSISLKHSITSNWSRFALNNMKDANFQHRRFGVLMSFSRFSPYYSNYQDNVYEASITLKNSPITFDLNNEFTRCRVFFGYNNKPFIVQMNYGNKTADADMIPPIDTLRQIDWAVPPFTDELTLTFRGNHSPDIYGLALDGEEGVALDNIPLRGSRGTGFTKTDTAFLHSMMRELNVKLILMHFGVNLVPSIKANYDFYEQRFYEQLEMFKSIGDDINIIVMGVTDMSRKKGGGFQSYPNIEKIRDAQKRAAFRANCAFWDTYEAMGGENSMPGWVFTEPPLARKDFTHFTYKGSVVIAKMFYKALMKDYHAYLLKQQKRKINTKADST